MRGILTTTQAQRAMRLMETLPVRIVERIKRDNPIPRELLDALEAANRRK